MVTVLREELTVDLRTDPLQELESAYAERLALLNSEPVSLRAMAASDARVHRLEELLVAQRRHRVAVDRGDPSYWWG